MFWFFLGSILPMATIAGPVASNTCGQVLPKDVTYVTDQNALKFDLDCDIKNLNLEVFNILLECVDDVCHQGRYNYEEAVLNLEICNSDGLVQLTDDVISFVSYRPKILVANCEQQYGEFQTKPGRADKVNEASAFCYYDNTVGIKWRPPYPPTGNVSSYNIGYILNNNMKKFLKLHYPIAPGTDHFEYIYLPDMEPAAEYQITITTAIDGVEDLGEPSTFTFKTNMLNSAQDPLEIKWEPEANNIIINYRDSLEKCRPQNLNIKVNDNGPTSIDQHEIESGYIVDLNKCKSPDCVVQILTNDKLFTNMSLYQNTCKNISREFQSLVLCSADDDSCKIMVTKPEKSAQKLSLILMLDQNDNNCHRDISSHLHKISKNCKNESCREAAVLELQGEEHHSYLSANLKKELRNFVSNRSVFVLQEESDVEDIPKGDDHSAAIKNSSSRIMNNLLITAFIVVVIAHFK